MRIGLIAPIARRVAPDTPSSIEQVVRMLAECLRRRGHEVTLFATGDSDTTATLAYTYPRSYRAESELWRYWQFHETVHTAAAFERAADFDVLHSHVYAFPAPLCRLVDTPVVHTDHCSPEPDLLRCYARYPELSVVALSEYHRVKLAGVGPVEVVPNGVEFAEFPFGAAGGDHLLFLGHLNADKGPVQAIEVARRAGLPIVLAGCGEGEYFDREVRPLLTDPAVTHVGPVGVAERNRLLAGAAALVFTSQYVEPFGLVLVEAMACGTPVLALRRCAVPEIVETGVTGAYAPDVETLAARAEEVVGLDRAAVRAAARGRFDADRMTRDYERVYEQLVSSRR